MRANFGRHPRVITFSVAYPFVPSQTAKQARALRQRIGKLRMVPILHRSAKNPDPLTIAQAEQQLGRDPV